jgi:hypothetical protein
MVFGVYLVEQQCRHLFHGIERLDDGQQRRGGIDLDVPPAVAGAIT